MKELWIYDTIGEGFFTEGVTAKHVRDELATAKSNDRLLVRINSPGGNVFEAVSIGTMLSQHKGGVDVQIDGVAASAASYLATFGDTVTIADGAMMMIHDPWTLAVGNRDDLRKAADMLDKISVSLANAYANKSGKSAEEIHAAMLAETWFTADEAIAYGLASGKLAVAANAYTIPVEFGYRNAPAAKAQTPESVASIEAMRRRIDLFRKAC